MMLPPRSMTWRYVRVANAKLAQEWIGERRIRLCWMLRMISCRAMLAFSSCLSQLHLYTPGL